MKTTLLTILSLIACSWLSMGWTSYPVVEKPSLREGKDYALFFAVDDYTKMGKLSNPIQNATDIARELETAYGFITEVVPNPSLIDIEQKLAEYRRKFREGHFDQQGQFLIFFTGHGLQRGRNGYFVPADGDPATIHRTGVEYDWLRSEIDAFACQHILVTIDACHSITFDPAWESKTDRDFGRKGDATRDKVLQAHQQYKARLFVTSDAEGNETPDRSSLARELLGALRNHYGPNGYLSHDELFGTYLKPNAFPTPGGGEFGTDEVGSRFLFFRTGLKDDERERTATDLATYQKASNSNNCEDYRAYARQFPQGDFIEVVRLQLAQCDQQQQELLAWEAAKRINTRQAYNDFIGQYQNSIYRIAAEAKRDALPPDKTVPPDNMVFIPGGTFEMGDQFGDGGSDEKPLHNVNLSDFYLGRTEVTVAHFAAFVAASAYETDAEKGNGSYIWEGSNWTKKDGTNWRHDEEGRERPGSQWNHPVVNVSWNDAIAYCNWLSQEQALTPVYQIRGDNVSVNWSANGYRLPTEAEWEYAARDQGKKIKYSWGNGSPDGNVADETAGKRFRSWIIFDGYTDGYVFSAPVGQFQEGSLGLSDMTGNVWEWCWDWYGSYSSSTQTNPYGPDSGSVRVARGGSWINSPAKVRCAFRDSNGPGDRYSIIGFRLARAGR
jgi:formylglycine-generating enzyme required for sulfatase activity